MKRRGRHRYAAALGLISLVAAAAILILGVPTASSGSNKIHGRMLGISNFPCASATGICSRFTATGSIKGEGTVFIDTFPTDEDGDGLALSKAHTIIKTAKGDLTCHEVAAFDLTRPDHPFVDQCMVTGGTGMYEGAGGYIQESGTFDFAANRGELSYIGVLDIVQGD